eukprot:Lithocolla_globosa_v1_NODE_60_length_7376_cov_322.464554.p4 type:complete len:202 gc:universal NODE_60_length_7376_cov_322.464554:1485-2090(+)
MGSIINPSNQKSSLLLLATMNSGSPSLNSFSPSPSPSSSLSTWKWNKCIICQKNSSENLNHPSQVKGQTTMKEAGVWTSFLGRIDSFLQLDSLPATLHPDFHSFTSSDFLKNCAGWHRSCNTKFSAQELLRKQERKTREVAKKKRVPSPIPSESPRLKRHKFDNLCCFFCKLQTSDKLVEVQTKNFCSRLLKMAQELDDLF